MRFIRRLYSELSYSRLKVTQSTQLKAKPSDYSKLTFGSVFTDHMLEVDWTEADGWTDPEIKPYQSLSLDPACSVFHYCTECYEGFKVYSNEGKFISFRPDMNMKRFMSSSTAAGLPECDKDELLKCIDALIKLDQSWVPQKQGFSLYVRPNMFGTHAQLSVTKPKKAKIVVILSPVGPYFPTGLKPISLYCDEKIVRAWEGGVGHKKVGGNYASNIIHAERVQKKGYGQVLWLYEGKVTESGVMNFFIVLKQKDGLELVTSPVNDLTLPGVTRDSVLQLHRDEGKLKVSERNYYIDEVIQAFEEGRVVEAFGTGTAAVVCPINMIVYKDKEYAIRNANSDVGDITKYTLDTLINIQFGKIKHKWSHEIN